MDQTERALDFIHGRMTPEDAARFEAELALSPELQAEMALIKTVQEQAKLDPSDTPSADEGWVTLKASIAAANAPEPANSNVPFAALKVAGIAAAAIMVWQIAVVPLAFGTAPDGFRAAAVAEDALALRVAFTEAADIAAVTALMRDVGAQIVEGPSAIGLYTLSFEDAAARDEAEQRLMNASGLVMTVSRP